MKLKPMIAGKANRKVVALTVASPLLLAVAALLLAPATMKAVDPVGAKAAGKNAPVALEAVPGSSVKRVTLSAKAAERLGIETGKVGEEAIVRRQMVSGLVTVPADTLNSGEKPAGGTFGGFAQVGAFPAPAVPPNPGGKSANLAKVAAVSATSATPQKLGGAFGSLAAANAALVPPPVPATVQVGDAPNGAAPAIVGDAWVLVAVSPGEWERLAKDKPVRLLALPTRDKLGREVLAQPSGMAPVEDPKRSMLSLYYVVPGKDHGLTLNSRLRVELQMAGNEDKQKVVPYSAVYYDGKGAPWVYVNSKPLTFERQRIAVERVVGDLAVLSDGPPVGTSVVTVGAALLYGTEVFGK